MSTVYSQYVIGTHTRLRS